MCPKCCGLLVLGEEYSTIMFKGFLTASILIFLEEWDWLKKFSTKKEESKKKFI